MGKKRNERLVYMGKTTGKKLENRDTTKPNKLK